MIETTVVLGSNSFSGSHFINYALSRGIKTIGISRSREIDTAFLSYKNNSQKENFLFYQFDLNKNLDQILDIINDYKANYVINFAAQSMVGESWQHPEHWFQTNVMANIKLHEGLRKLDFLKKYVHVSTPEVYGNCEGNISENVNYYPSTPYAVSRAAADMSLMSYYRAYNFPVVFIRAANVFGPGQQLYRIIPRTILFFLLGKKLELHGGGKSVRSFIHIKDVADGTLKAMNLASPGEIFHFSNSQTISIKDLVKVIARKMNISFENNVQIAEERLGKDSAYLLDSSKAKKVLGWEPKIELEEGIEETIQWVKNNLNKLKKMPFNYIHKP